MNKSLLSYLPDHELISRFHNLVIEEREHLVFQLDYLAEMDRRKLFYQYNSLRAYVVAEHGLGVVEKVRIPIADAMTVAASSGVEHGGANGADLVNEPTTL